MVSKEVREEARKYVGGGYLRQALERGNPQSLSREAIDYILDAVMIYRRF